MDKIKKQSQAGIPKDVYQLRPLEIILGVSFHRSFGAEIEAIEVAIPSMDFPHAFWALREVAHWHVAAQASCMSWFWKSRWEAEMAPGESLEYEDEARSHARTFLSRGLAWQLFCEAFILDPNHWLRLIPGEDTLMSSPDYILEFMDNTELKRSSFRPSEKAVSLMLRGYEDRFRMALERRRGREPESVSSK